MIRTDYNSLGMDTAKKKKVDHCVTESNDARNNNKKINKQIVRDLLVKIRKKTRQNINVEKIEIMKMIIHIFIYILYYLWKRFDCCFCFQWLIIFHFSSACVIFKFFLFFPLYKQLQYGTTHTVN
jgi:Na+/pantothenate symporter